MKDVAVGFALALTLGFAGCAGADTSTNQNTQTASTDRSSDAQVVTPEATDPPTPKPTPAESYEHRRIREKREFIGFVDESISGARIAGNAYKFVGDNVDLHCTVEDIPDQAWFNADCGSEDDPAIIVIEYEDTASLEKGQAVRILGTVDDPMEGTNAMGGERKFPTVKAEFME